ncbi:MAG: hypothetical protein JW821_01770 [Deltaproteobacteria bacterium]|nr:hypothetical protein [Deltaproteobacteria bacterium]
MASITKRRKAVKKWKATPNKANRKADEKRTQKNREILRDLAAKDAS